MKTTIVITALFAALAMAAPSEEPTKVLGKRGPSKTRGQGFYGQQYCECVDDCKISSPTRHASRHEREADRLRAGENAGAGSGGEGGVGLAGCLDGCYDFPTPTDENCVAHGYKL
jgi:hypothetical protein